MQREKAFATISVMYQHSSEAIVHTCCSHNIISQTPYMDYGAQSDNFCIGIRGWGYAELLHTARIPNRKVEVVYK